MSIKIIQSEQVREGKNLLVNRPFPSKTNRELDPFLLLDELGPIDLKGEVQETPPHPHGGFEIITYVIKGQVHHEDSLENTFDLGDGDIQWMTAGSGIEHLEKFSSTGGPAHALQLWINLPKDKKYLKPGYQVIQANQIPVHIEEGLKVKVIAGSYKGVSSPISTQLPIQYHHYSMDKNTELKLPLQKGHRNFVYILGEAIEVDGVSYVKGQNLLFSEDLESVSLKNPAESQVDFVYLSGAPLKEPIARYGPFVFNTAEEIQKAIRDYQNGLFGFISKKK